MQQFFAINLSHQHDWSLPGRFPHMEGLSGYQRLTRRA
jgi:hypothetical protein